MAGESQSQPAAAETPSGSASVPHVLRASGRSGANPARIEPYDFRNPLFLSEVELRRLRQLHEDFIRYLGSRLSLLFRMEFGLKLARLHTCAFAKFAAALPSPVHACLFKTEPLVGIGVLSVSPPLALAMADRLLGGRGEPFKAERDLTEIEVTLLEDVIRIMLDEWADHWRSGQELRPAVIGHETSGRFLQTSSKDAIMLVLGLEVAFGECVDTLQISVPYAMVEALVKQKLHAHRQKEGAGAGPRSAAWQPAYDHIGMPVRAEWQAFEATLREVSCLRVGDVIELPASLIQETRLLLNGSPKFIGTVGLEADRVAVKITRLAPPQEEDFPHANPDGRKDP
jgi:flagellar motor switch protein FliM